MASIMPEGELVRRAAAWICEDRAAKKDKNLLACLDEAGMRFNLSPKDQCMLAALFTESGRPDDTSAAGRPD